MYTYDIQKVWINKLSTSNVLSLKIQNNTIRKHYNFTTYLTQTLKNGGFWYSTEYTSKVKKRESRYWSTESRAFMIDWLIFCCFYYRTQIIHSCRESLSPMKRRPKINITHLLFMGTFCSKLWNDIKNLLSTGWMHIIIIIFISLL